MRQVEKDVRLARPPQLGDNRARDHVPRRQLVGEAVARAVAQHAALAAQRFDSRKRGAPLTCSAVG